MAADVIFTAFDFEGAPLVGLTPDYVAYRNAETGAELAPEELPAIAAIGNGCYRVVAPADAYAFIIDLGELARVRYLLVEPKTRVVFMALGADGAPDGSRGPAWETYGRNSVLLEEGAPTITNLGDGLYRIDDIAADAFGVIDLDVGADPRRISIVPSDFDSIAPVVENVSPTPGAGLPRLSSLRFDVTDASNELRLVFVWVTFAALGTDEVAFDGVAFTPLYAGSSRTVITGGYRYTLARTGGWPSAPTLNVVPIDVAGNEAA